MDISDRALTIREEIIKRVFDLIVSAIGLFFTTPIIFFAWVIASIETMSNGFFLQERVGKGGENFNVIKIKTMKKVDGFDTNITSSDDVRITKSGAFFRNTKIDELPQLWNVLIGQMSFVGPRPDVPGYADELEGADRIILSIRPGITGPASFKYKEEERILAEQESSKYYNDNVLWPDKVRINRQYIKDYSFSKDLMYIYKTIFN